MWLENERILVKVNYNIFEVTYNCYIDTPPCEQQYQLEIMKIDYEGVDVTNIIAMSLQEQIENKLIEILKDDTR